MSAGLCAINKQGLAENMAHGEKVGKLKALYENLESNTSKPTKTERNSSRSNSLDNSSKEKIKTILANSITELHTIVQSSSHHQASALPSEERADQGGCNHAALPKDLSLAGTLEVHRDLEQNTMMEAPQAVQSSFQSTGAELRIDGLQDDSMNQERETDGVEDPLQQERANAAQEFRAADDAVDLDLFEQCGEDARMDHQRESEAACAGGSAKIQERGKGLAEEALHNFLRNQISMNSMSGLSDRTNSGGSPRLNSPHGFSKEELNIAAIDAGNAIDSRWLLHECEGFSWNEIILAVEQHLISNGCVKGRILACRFLSRIATDQSCCKRICSRPQLLDLIGDTLSQICREVKSDITDDVDQSANNDSNMHCALCLSYIVLCCARLGEDASDVLVQRTNLISGLCRTISTLSSSRIHETAMMALAFMAQYPCNIDRFKNTKVSSISNSVVVHYLKKLQISLKRRSTAASGGENLEKVVLQSVKVVVSAASVCMLLGESCVPQSEVEVVKYAVKLLKQFMMREGFLSAPSDRGGDLDPSYSHGKVLVLLRALSCAAQGGVGTRLQHQLLRSDVGIPLLAVVVSSSVEWDGPLSSLMTKATDARCSRSEDPTRGQACCVLKESVNLLIVLLKHEHLVEDSPWVLSDFLHTNHKGRQPFWWNWQGSEESFLSQRAGASEDEDIHGTSKDDGQGLFLSQLLQASLSQVKRRYEDDSNMNIMCTRLSHMVEDLV